MRRRLQPRRATIGQALALHDAHSPPGSLEDYLCDGYLLETNRYLRNLRDAVLALGYRFSTTEPVDYYAWQLIGLSEMLERRIIPYSDTVTQLRAVEARAPGVVKLGELPGVLKRSNIFHESLHCVADTATRRYLRRPTARLDAARSTVFAYMIAEAIANTGETLSPQLTSDPFDRFVLTSWHSQIVPARAAEAAVARLCDRFGRPFVFQVMVFGYLMFHLMFTEVGQHVCDRVLALLSPATAPSDEERGELRRVMEAALFLNHAARVYTAHDFFRYDGILVYKSRTAFMRDVRSFPFLEIFEAEPAYLRIVEVAADVAEHGAASVELERLRATAVDRRRRRSGANA